MDVFNLAGDDLEFENDREGFRCRGTRVGPRIGGAEIGGAVYELPRGERTWPYHFHRANEEWLLVLAGRPTLRDPAGERSLSPGDVVCFPCGPEGAHQLRNDDEQPARFLLLSTVLAPEIVEYPDSGKVGVRGEGAHYQVARQPDLDYWDGES